MSSASKYDKRKTGDPGTRDFRVYITADGNLVSPWHEIPLFASDEPGLVNMVVEIPRWSNTKMEIAKDELTNPLRQSFQGDRLQYISNIFPHKGFPLNYGSLPQTWEDPEIQDPNTKAPGDSDPLDVCELAGAVSSTGTVKQVKVLGAFAVMDQGRTDWKIVAVDTANILASRVDDIPDVEENLPGYLTTMLGWFRVYKVPESEKENEIGMEGGVQGRDFAMSLIRRSHSSWERSLADPAMKTKVSMTDIGIEDVNPAQQPSEMHNPNLRHDDRVAMEKYHFVSPTSTTEA